MEAREVIQNKLDAELINENNKIRHLSTIPRERIKKITQYQPIRDLEDKYRKMFCFVLFFQESIVIPCRKTRGF